MGRQLAGSPGLGHTAVFDSGGSKAAAEYIATEMAADPTQPVVLYGHSWGGAAAVGTAQELKQMGITVNVMITLDAVNQGLGAGSSTILVPDNVEVAVNYYQTDFLINAPFGNNRMAAADPGQTQILNIEVPGTNHENIDNKFGDNVVRLIQEIGLDRVLSWFTP
jgi:pimeloyl-ACP methyl ester carboxylesterase